MIFSWFKKSKSTSLKFKQNQEMEVEFANEDGGFETHFTKVLDVQSKKVIIKSPGTERRPVRMIPGQPISVTVIDDNRLSSFDTKVIDAGEREFDIATPTGVKDENLPVFDDAHQLEVSIKVEFRAMNSAHNQMASTYSVAPSGLTLVTNLPVPAGTSLHLEVEIPGAPDFSITGRATGCRVHPSLKGKHLCEVEYNGVSEAESSSIIRYAIYAKKRAERQALREAEAAK